MEQRKRNLRKIDIKNYPVNAATNFKFLRLIIYILVSGGLTALLIITTIQANYQKATAIIFCMVAIVIIAAFTLLNIAALIIKIIRKVKEKEVKKEEIK